MGSCGRDWIIVEFGFTWLEFFFLQRLKLRVVNGKWQRCLGNPSEKGKRR